MCVTVKFETVRDTEFNNLVFLVVISMTLEAELMDHESLDDRIEQCNRTYSNVFWVPLRLEGSHTNALVQFNKQRGFTQFQRKLLRENIAQYCLTAVSQFLILREKEVSQYRIDVLEELLSHHMKIGDIDPSKKFQSHGNRLELTENNSVSYRADQAFEGEVEALCLRETRLFDEHCTPDFHRFTFVPRSLNQVDSVEATLFMFYQLRFVQRWQIPMPVLTRFVLTVQRNYRNPPYHNWTHAFCVGHFAFLCLTNASQRLESYLDPLELFALFVGALCHDIDHRGYNNAYQGFPLAIPRLFVRFRCAMARPAARAVHHPLNVGLDRIPTSCRDDPLNVEKTTPPIWPSVVFRLPCLARWSDPVER
ncbi:cGMP-dependent 3',5'-cyclic phosphodiesterase [Paragonimus westermani]|uniref:cGMP-dependent 3',5'-cyclic phosphodiesterase n=1 Tax=Paragonimus westermani TaxID=34504 RepID=A0A5J4P2U5_9TREM|nr:cGMP-dependent 3',5'-cyclic phosphodiesterase [Paragonimus westermani]